MIYDYMLYVHPISTPAAHPGDDDLCTKLRNNYTKRQAFYSLKSQ